MYTGAMSTAQKFTHAIASPSVRRDIALAVRAGVPVDQLAETFAISVSTVNRYVKEWEGARRRTAALQPDEVAAIRAGVARGARRRYEREYTAAVVRHVLGEE